MKIKNGILKEQLQLNNTILKNGPFRLFWKIAFFVIFILLIISSIYVINFSFSNSGFLLFANNLKNFFSPSSISFDYKQNLFLISIKFLWNSIKLVFLSTIIGFFIAFWTSYSSNLKTNSKFIAIPVKIIVIFLRIFPELFFIYLFKISFDKSLAITLIYCWFTWLWLHEYFSQTIENANFNVFYHLTKSKYSKFKAFWIEIWPQIRKKFISYWFYSFETNLRWSSILSSIGYLGIGILVNPVSNPVDYTQLLIPLLVLASFLFLLEIMSENFNKLFYESKTNNKINFIKYEKIRVIKKVFIMILFILLLSILILAIKSLSNNHFYKSEAISFFKQMFNSNWKSIIWDFSQDGFFWMLIQLISLVFLTFVLIYVISYFKMILIAKQLVGIKFGIFYKYFNIFIRSIPITILFLLVSNLFNEYAASFVIAFSIHSSSSLSRNLNQSINSISIKKINELKKMKYTNFWIYKNFIRPNIKLDFITFCSFELEKISRNFITYGSLGSSIIGQKSTLTRAKDISDIAPYLWIGFIIIAIINLISYLFRIRLSKQK
ncbi:ABC transporter permease [Metamycoplasma canadense]|uniref:Alkylphosphonate ABC transporter n=1 Tax=Metamycoplasma canadense TaxID=29554 RepID=A0A077L926_9BACT|nr:ABC transporter permease [Metamycoplasma canadense]BAP39503.1 alkylphosphonate ABC transporter [Metamycoplasma canadense]